MTDEKQTPKKRPGPDNPDQTSGKYDQISQKFKKEFMAFLEERKKNKQPLPKKKDELIRLFLEKTKKTNTSLFDSYKAYLSLLTQKASFEEITFADLEQTPLGKEGKLSEVLAARQAENFEDSKQEVVFDMWSRHYTAAIQATNDKSCIENWHSLLKGRFGAEGKKKLLTAKKLLPTLQSLFQDFFKKTTAQQKKHIHTHLRDGATRPTIGMYLQAFAASGADIKNKLITDAFLQGTSKPGTKKTTGVKELDRSMVDLTWVTLLEEGVMTREAKESLIQNFDATFSHTQLTSGIFAEYPRTAYLQEKNPHRVYVEKYQHLIEKASQDGNDQEANQYRSLYEKHLLEHYFERIQEKTKKNKKLPKTKLIEHIALLNKLQGGEFSAHIETLKLTLSDYLKEDFLQKQINHDMIKAQMKQFDIPENHFTAYLDFRKQVYDLGNTQAVFIIQEGTTYREMKLNFTRKELIAHPHKCTGIDTLDQMFSFERTIDFESSDQIFKQLFGNTPKTYIVDDETDEVVDTMNHEHDIPIYHGSTGLQHRILIDKKTPLTVTFNGREYTGYPHMIYTEEDTQLHDPETFVPEGTLALQDPIDERIILNIPLQTASGTTSNEYMHILDTAYQINSHTRTFTQPANPPLLQSFMQVALFNKMAPEHKRIPTKSVTDQVDMLHTPHHYQPDLTGYTSTTTQKPLAEKSIQELEKQLARERFTAHNLVSSAEIPAHILDETQKRFPRMAKKDLPMQVKAWIKQGELFFHEDYFCNTYNFVHIERKENIFWFTDTNGVTYNSEDITHKDRIKACLEELISAKTHETAHRLFHFHYINDLEYTTREQQTLTLTQENLCEFADGMSYPWQQDASTKEYYIDFEQNKVSYRIWLQDIEQLLEKKGIAGFKRANIAQLDANSLEAYIQAYETFSDQLIANTATSSDPVSSQTVQAGRNAVLHQLNKRIEQLRDNYDPTNTQQAAQLTEAQQHLDTITNQEQQLAATPSQDDLDAMHQQQIDAAQFLQQQRQNNRSQPTPENNATPSPDNTSSSSNSTTTAAPQDENSDNTDPQESESPETETVTEEQRNSFDTEFMSLQGDKGAPVEKGTSLFLKENISAIPGRGFNWVKYTILGVTNDTITLEMSDASEKKVTKKQLIERPRNEATIQELKRVGKGDVYKFGKAGATKAGFMHSIQHIVGGKRAETNNFCKTISLDNKTTTEKITHVGTLEEKIVGSDRSESTLYEVDWGLNSVTVTAAVPDGDKSDQKKKALWTKKMDYDTFQMFCTTKGLNPLTSTEVKRSGQKLSAKDAANASEYNLQQGISLGAWWKALQAIPETYKKKFEEEQEFQAALATDYVSNLIPKTSLLYLDEIANDLGGTDGVVRNRIQKFKSEWAATGDSDKASIHDNPISENIKANVFEDIRSSRRWKYKAAGALLYALEKGGPYFRALSEYANKDGGGRWVRCLLGETARQQFLEERQRMIDQYKSQGGSSDTLQSEIAKFELQFIENATKENESYWGSKFGRQIEDHKDTLYGGANSLDPSAFSKKGDFPYIFDAFWGGGIGQNLPWILMSSLEAMKGAVEDPKHYNQFYMSILMIFATGMVHMLPKDYVDRLKGIGRSRGIPITLMAGDSHASGKVMRILDHIAQNAGIRTFSEFSGYSLDHFDQMHVHNYADNRGNIRNSFANWWSNHGWTIMDAFNYKNEFLINMPDNENKNSKIANEYLGGGGVFGGYKGIQDQESLGQVDGQNPFFEEGLLNLSQGSFRGFMMRFNQGQFVSEHQQTLWSNFAGILGQFDANIKSSSNEKANHVMTQLLYKKFVTFFENELNPSADMSTNPEWQGKTYKELFDAGIRGEVSLERVIKKSIFKEKERTQKGTDQVYIAHETISNGLVKDTILKFASLVKGSYDNLQSEAHKRDIFGS